MEGHALLTILGVLAVSSFTSGQLVSWDQFRNGAEWNGYPAPQYNQYEAFIAHLESAAGITTPQEAAMAYAQFLHESDGLRAKEEYRCINNGCKGDYETPGCDNPNHDYYGRGYIQLTWCDNYKQASIDLYGSAWMVDEPEAVANDEYVAWDTAFWYWKSRVHWAPGVQEGQFGATTRAINGQLECENPNGHGIARHRFDMYNIVRSAFGLQGNGDERGCYN